MSIEEMHGVRGRILCIHQGAVGDLILALPAIKALRDCLQPRWLEIMGHPWTVPLVCGHPYADAVADCNRAEMAPLFLEGASLSAELKGYLGTFDAAFCFSRSTTLAHNLKKAGIKQTVLLPPFPTKRQHLIDHHLSSLRTLGIAAVSATPKVYLREDEKEWAEEFFRRRCLNRHEIIALHPGAGSRKKAWPAGRFAALGRALTREGESRRLLIIQGPADEWAVEGVVAGLEGVPYLVARDMPIIKLAALLSRARLFIGNDSGCSHLAAALGVPTLALFGPTDPLCWAPRGEHASWLQGKSECAPCTPETLRTCQRQRCLEAIEKETVLACIAEKPMAIDTGTTRKHKERETPPHQQFERSEGISVPLP
jgi:ADP-heptose:LPS heptosyltransferase